MSKDPNNNPPPKTGGQESLADAIYRSSLSEGNASVQRANPLVSVPLAALTLAGISFGLWQVAKRSEAVQKVVKKTIGIDLQEQAEEEAPPPPPPPPPAPAAPAAPRVEAPKDAPPPPPINPNQDIVPEVAPKELPKENLALAYAGQQSGSGGPGGGVAGGGVAGTGMAVAGAASQAAKVVEFDYNMIKVKVQPPAPPYPNIARIAKIQGTVVVEIIVGVDGIPVSAKAIEGPAQLRAYAENYARSWRFEPAMQNGQPVQAKFKLTMPFKLQ